MKIGVLIKPVPDTEARIRIASDARGIDESDIKFVPNPFDEYAYEEALKLHEKLGDGEVVAITVAGAQAKDMLKKAALAVGCHRAVHVQTADNEKLDAVQTAAILAKVIAEENMDIVFCGKQAIDMDQAQVPFQIAAKLDWPVVPAIVEFTLQEDGKTVVVARDTDKGREKIQVSLPAVFSTTKGLNDPRYAKLKGIMAAKKKPLDELTTTALGLPEVTSVVVNVSLPPARKAPVKVEGEFPTNVIKLVDLLRNEAKVI